MTIIITLIISLILDQITKNYIISHFRLHQSVPVIEGILHISYVTNKGGAFGIMSGFPYFFMILAILMMLAGIIFFKYLIQQPLWVQLATGMIWSGTLGNLIDRLRLGHVIDFIDFRVWPTFNVADICITVGVFILIFYILKQDLNPIKSLEEHPQEEHHEEEKTPTEHSTI